MAEDQLAAKLYSTKSCHLCEAAERVLIGGRVAVTKIDIVSDVALLKKYGLRIPVLQRIDNGAELDWPFDAEAVADFLK